jgi:hypothetical protein
MFSSRFSWQRHTPPGCGFGLAEEGNPSRCLGRFPSSWVPSISHCSLALFRYSSWSQVKGKVPLSAARFSRVSLDCRSSLQKYPCGWRGSSLSHPVCSPAQQKPPAPNFIGAGGSMGIWRASRRPGKRIPRGQSPSLLIPESLSQYISSPPGPGAPPLSSLGFSATRASLVNSSVATLAAFCRAVRVTLVGSITPAFTRSS